MRVLVSALELAKFTFDDGDHIVPIPMNTILARSYKMITYMCDVYLHAGRVFVILC